MSSPSYRLPRLNRPSRVAAAALAGASTGLVLGLVMPRGPMTSIQSLTALALALGAGVLAGRLMRSRWAALVAPLALAAVFEATWAGTEGPSVGPIHLDNVYAVIVLIAGRGFDGLLILFPMVVGGLWGAALSRRNQPVRAGIRTRARGRTSLGLVVRRGTLALASLAVVVLVVALAWPASTEAISGSDGEPLPGSIAERQGT